MEQEAAADGDPGRVVVGFDGSSDGERGLEWAIRYAELRGLSVEVISTSGDLEYLHERTAHNVDDLIRRWERQASELLQESSLTDWTATTSRGKAVPELLDASRTATLVVIGARGHGLLGGMLLGSVSQHVTRHAECPVVVVRGPRAARSNRVVVGVDGSEPAEAALRFGFEHAQALGGPVVAVHGRAVSAINGPFDTSVSPTVSREMEEAESLLREAVSGLSEEYPDVGVELLAVPVPPVRAIADASANAALVAVGTRGLGGFLGLLLGSVSATVLQHAECPVAVVR